MQARTTACASNLLLALLPALASTQDGRDALARGYAADAAGDRASAWHAYRDATASGDASIYDRACKGVVYDAPLQRRQLPDPYYAAVYAAPIWMSRHYSGDQVALRDFDDTVWQSKARFGRYLDEDKRVSAYGYARINADSASSGGGVLQIYNDNYAGIGAGIDYRPLPSLRLYLEAGQDYDLENRNRDRGRGDVNLGVDYYSGWGSNPSCSYTLRWPMAPFADLYASAVAYSRYDDNVIGQVTGRLGLRVSSYRYSAVSAYLLGNLTYDSVGLYYNRAFEVGPGLEWRPHLAWPVSLRIEYRRGRYLDAVPDGAGHGYSTLMFQGIVYFEQ